MKRIISILLLVFLLSGCSMLSKAQVKAPQPPLLEQDKIYTIPKGTEVTILYLDGKQIGPQYFGFDMKLVAPNVLIEQEEKLNKALFSKIKTDQQNSTRMKILGGIFGFLATLGGAWALALAKKKFLK